MQYLMISNPGVAHVEAFTLLGVSTSRGNDNKIGQFGSGNKHGLLVCLRLGLDPVIFLGEERLAFGTKEGKMGDQSYQQVVYTFRGVEEKLSYSLEFGALDWTNIHMGLREFISNAIDAVGAEQVTMGLTDNPNPIPGCTTVYVPATPEVIQYYRNINYYFLHFRKMESVRVLPKQSEGTPCVIYRKGVFVRELKSGNSIWDYNFDASTSIDESRNMDDFNCKWYATRLAAKEADAGKYIRATMNDTKCIEADINTSGLDSHRMREFQAAFKEIYGDAVIASPTNGHGIDTAKRKGYKVIIVQSTPMYLHLIECKVPSVTKVLSESEGITETIVETTHAMNRIHRTCWEWLKDLTLTKGKACPGLRAFRSVMDASHIKMGFYHDGYVYINVENALSVQTYLEEMAHYITGAKDETRDFQDFAFNIAARGLIKEKGLEA
jgi:hypothetical protein